MKRSILIILSFLCINISYSQDAEKVYEKAVSSVGLISDMRGIGSGFFVNSTTFVTNRHVSTELNFSNTLIRLKDGSKIRLVKKLFEDKSNDLAAYETEPVSSYLSLANESGPKIGDKIFAIGNPTSNFNVYKFTFTEGIINNITNEEIPFPEYPISAHIILHSATLNKGNSGGPLLNSKGELIGINSYFYPKGNNQFIAIHVSELISMLKKYSINYNSNILSNNQKDSTKSKDSLNNTGINNLIPKIKNDSVQTTRAVNSKNNNSVLIIFIIFGSIFVLIVFAISNSNKKHKNFVYQPAAQPILQENNGHQLKSNRHYINNNREVNIKSVLYYNGRNYSLSKTETYIGRDTDCDVVISGDVFISKKHCKITKTNGFFYLIDLFSKNGTLLNRGRINTAVLKDRDVIKIGNSEIIFYKYN